MRKEPLVSNKIGPPDLRVVERRWKRFFGAGGICEHFERGGDHLMQFGDIVEWLTTAGLNRDVVVSRFGSV